MKKLFPLLLSLLLLLTAGCGMSADESDRAEEQTAALDLSRPILPPAEFKGKRILVAFFSHTGENYEVGMIEKGNTHIVADQIAELTQADAAFEIRTVSPYPRDYQEMTRVAKQEQIDQARPALAARVNDMADYDIIFLGYPIWYYDLPMPVYTFLESYDFSGKTIIPFCTGMSDTMSGMEEEIPHFAKGAVMRPGLGIQGKRAQFDPAHVRVDVANWLASLGYTN